MEKNWATGHQHPESKQEKASEWLELSLALQSIPGSPRGSSLVPGWRLELFLESLLVPGWPRGLFLESPSAPGWSLALFLESPLIPGWPWLPPESRVRCSVQKSESWKAAHRMG
jgi:hypothetical protein